MGSTDAVAGWDDEINAELYDQFARTYPFYIETSRELVTRADLANRKLVVDLCGGTGITAAALLEAMPLDSRVISVDAAEAMQRIARRIADARITWIVSRAEALDQHIHAQVDAVVCNSAIWKTDIPAVFDVVKRILRPGGRFVFNVGGSFAGLSAEDQERTEPSLNDLITAIAVADHGYVPPSPPAEHAALTAASVRNHLVVAGLKVSALEIVTHIGTVQEKHAWLSIPLFARSPGQLTYEQRMQILAKAYAKVDKTRPTTTKWLVVTAEA